MAKLTATRGLPGSGKTTWARTQPDWVWRVNRDDLRAMLRRPWRHGHQEDEELCTEVQHAAIRALLADQLDVVVDDTNLRRSVIEALADLAGEVGAEFEIRDFTDVPLDECIARDAARDRPVGAEVIQRMYERYLAAPGEPSPVPAAPLNCGCGRIHIPKPEAAHSMPSHEDKGE